MSKNIAVNIEKCLACRSCEIACALVHSESKVLEEAVNESPRPQRRVTVESAEGFAQCRHCEDAPCITVCPTGAIHRHQASDPVLIDKGKCIGCRFCLMVCPFGVIDVTRDGKAVVKCDLCIERTKAGQEPACVAACPTGALELADERELAADKRKRTARGLAIATQQDNERNSLEGNP
ncbi:MAG: 4Fe-4S dicluster domain-containing protein [Planctomycetota bacterium]